MIGHGLIEFGHERATVSSSQNSETLKKIPVDDGTVVHRSRERVDRPAWESRG